MAQLVTVCVYADWALSEKRQSANMGNNKRAEFQQQQKLYLKFEKTFYSIMACISWGLLRERKIQWNVALWSFLKFAQHVHHVTTNLHRIRSFLMYGFVFFFNNIQLGLLFIVSAHCNFLALLHSAQSQTKNFVEWPFGSYGGISGWQRLIRQPIVQCVTHKVNMERIYCFMFYIALPSLSIQHNFSFFQLNQLKYFFNYSQCTELHHVDWHQINKQTMLVFIKFYLLIYFLSKDINFSYGQNMLLSFVLHEKSTVIRTKCSFIELLPEESL